jgi:hypothetical protein
VAGRAREVELEDIVPRVVLPRGKLARPRRRKVHALRDECITNAEHPREEVRRRTNAEVAEKLHLYNPAQDLLSENFNGTLQVYAPDGYDLAKFGPQQVCERKFGISQSYGPTPKE